MLEAILLIVGLVAGYLVSLIWKQSRPKLTINPAGRMQLWKASILVAYLISSTVATGYAVYSLWDVQPPSADQSTKAPVCSAQSTLQLVALDPDSVAAGMAPRDINLLGCGFTEQTQVKLNGVARQFQLVAANKITVTLNTADVNSPGVIAVDVAPGGAQSAPAGNPVPPASSPAVPAISQTPPANKQAPLTDKILRIKPAKVLWYVGPKRWEITLEVQLVLLVLFTGAFGSSVYALKSIADFIGIKDLCESWFTFYLVQPWEGAGIAFLFYMVMRGGLLTGSAADVKAINPFGITALAALVGAFSDKALAKLRDVAEALFAAKDARPDKGIELAIITPSLLPNAGHTAPYRMTLQAANGTKPYTWSETAPLPIWLTLTPAGELSGTPPAVPQDFTFEIRVTDSANAVATKDFLLHVL
jgi:hypothetical protein